MNDQLDIQIEQFRFVISRTTTSDWKMPQRANKHYLLAYFKQGSGIYHISGQEYPIRSGNIILIPPGQFYHPIMDPADPWCYCTVGVCLQFGNETSRRLLHQLPFTAYAPELLDDFIQLQLAWDQDSSVSLLKCRSIALNILQHLLQGPPEKQFIKLGPVFSMIQQNTGKNFSLEFLANTVNLSVSCFRRQFKEATGMTVIEYQNKIKIKKAKQLLLNGDCNVSEAAREVGIDDVFYFSRLFRKLTGKNPSDYLS